MGSVLFGPQYQQKPLPAVGNIIKTHWLKTYPATFDHTKLGGRIIQSWDTASKTGTDNAFSVCTTAKVLRGEVWLLHVYRARLEFPDLKREAIRLAMEWQANDILIEDQASGEQLLQALWRDRPAGMAKPLACRPVGDKESRMIGVSGQIEAGQLLLPEEASWLVEFKAELLGFPNTQYKDQCDAITQLMSYVQRSGGSRGSSSLVGPIRWSTCEDGSVEITGDEDYPERTKAEWRALGFDPDEDPWGAK